jgi:hypothetical protein
MSTCTRCGASFGCAMVDGADGPCWCTRLPPLAALPAADQGQNEAAAAGCWCPACLEAHLAALARVREA